MGRRLKPNYELLGPKFGQMMKEAARKIENMSNSEIDSLLEVGSFDIEIGNGDKVTIEPSDVKVEELKNWNSYD